MKTVLFAAELGAGMGHAVPLLRMAGALRDRLREHGEEDFRAVFVLHDPQLVRDQLAPGDLAINAPRAVSQGDIRAHTASYAEILALSGFARKPDLEAGLAVWDDLFELIKPAVLVADHSPVAVLAARGRVPTLVTGNAFNAPPARIKQYPALLTHAAAPPIQQTMLRSVNEILRARGEAEISHLPLFMEGDARAVFMLPMFDPYGPLRDTPLLGTYEEDVTPLPMPDRSRIFLYSHTHLPLAPKLAQAAAKSGLPVSAYLSGTDTGTIAFLRRQGAEIFKTPPQLAEVLADATVVVSHAGAGLSQTALAAGRPQIVVPIHSESQMIARSLEKLGAAASFEEAGAELDVDRVAEAIREAGGAGSMRDAAQTQAKAIAQLGLPAKPLAAAATALHGLLAAR
jgi:hypothetical protein